MCIYFRIACPDCRRTSIYSEDTYNVCAVRLCAPEDCGPIRNTYDRVCPECENADRREARDYGRRRSSRPTHTADGARIPTIEDIMDHFGRTNLGPDWGRPDRSPFPSMAEAWDHQDRHRCGRSRYTQHRDNPRRHQTVHESRSPPRSRSRSRSHYREPSPGPHRRYSTRQPHYEHDGHYWEYSPQFRAFIDHDEPRRDGPRIHREYSYHEFPGQESYGREEYHQHEQEPTAVPLKPTPDPWLALGVPAGSNEATVKKAYVKLVLTCHPDKVAGLDEATKRRKQVQFLKVQAAYEVLTDPVKRKAYDEEAKRRGM